MPTTRAALYLRTSTLSLHNPDIFHDLRQTAAERGYQIVREFADRIGGNKAKRPALDQLLADARRGHFDVLVVESLSDLAPSVKQCVEVLHQLSQLGIGFVAPREEIDTTDTTTGQAMAVIVRGLAEVTRSVRIANVKEGMRRAALGGVKIGRTPLSVDRSAVVQDRLSGMSLSAVGKKHGVSRAFVCRLQRLSIGKTNSLPPQTEESLMLAESA